MENRLKILVYHSVDGQISHEIGEELYSVSADRFRKQMEYVKKGQSPVGYHRLAVRGTVPSVGTGPLLTFDDGLLNNYTVAFPILQEFGLKAYFFVIVSKIGSDGYMNWKQIKELKDAGMIIGSHGMRHQILVGLDNRELNYEIEMSKELIEGRLDISCDYFSIPLGHYNAEIIKKIRETGYKAVFTSNPKDNGHFKLGRIAVRPNWDLGYFIRVLNNGLSFGDHVEEFLKNSSKKIFGVNQYNRIRERILIGKGRRA